MTEHSRRLAMAHGLDAGRLVQQIDALDRLNEELEGITLLKGIEVDILEDGALDLPDDVLGRLDLCWVLSTAGSSCRGRRRRGGSCVRWTIRTSRSWRIRPGG